MNDEELIAGARRAFERYHANIAAQPWRRRTGPETATPGRVKGGRRIRSLAARGLALAAIGSLLVGAFIWVQAPTGTASSVFASWQRVPTAADPFLLQWALQNCPITGVPGTHPTTLVLQDQRGKAAYFVFADGDDFSTCLGADPRGGGGMAKGGGSFTHPGDPIEWAGGIQGWDDQAWIDVVGRAPGAARVEIVRTDGVVVEASVHSPLFAAWWPGRAWVTEIRALGADGQVLASLKSFPPAHWTTQPTASG
jgi:hypothetical protein